MMDRFTSLTVTTETVMQADHAYEVLSTVGRGLLREGYDLSVTVHKVTEDPWDQNEGPIDDSNKILSYRVHDILCRLGMTETEAHNAIAQINEAGITFVKEQA